MITVKEVKTRRDLKKFIDCPVKLYKDNPYFCPTLAIDEMMNLDPKKNPAYEYCETRLFLAYRDGEIVGRIGGLINHAYNEKIGKKQIRFTRFDVIDDIEVTKALFDEVIKWAKSRDIHEMIGPIGFCDLDKQGLLVDGFEEQNLFITLYNHPYYMKHLEQLGFVKDVDWVEYQIFAPEKINERFERLAEAIKKRYGYKIINLKSKRQAKKHIYEAFEIVNEAFSHLYGVVPLTREQMEIYVKQFTMLVNLDYLYLVTNKNDELIGFGLMAPSFAEATRKSKGKLFPLGWYRILRSIKKHDVLEMYLIAVKPEYQGLGVNALILYEGIKTALKNNVKICETGPELETNTKVQDLWKGFKTRQHRRRRCYKLTF